MPSRRRYNRRVRPWPLIAVFLLAASIASAQNLPCLRTRLHADPPLALRRVTILDGNRLPGDAKSQIARDLRAMCDCWPCAMSYELNDRIREEYQWRGFYQASADVDIVHLGLDRYDIVAHVNEGPQYRLAEIQFRNAKAFPVSELRRLFPLQTGELFDTRKVREGIEALRRLYGTRGYINFTPIPEPTLNRDTGTVTLTIDTDEGPVFKLGPLVITGAENRQPFTKRILAAWRPHIGQVYDSNFVEQFLDDALNGVEGTPPRIDLRQDNATAIVSVRLEFTK